MRKADLTFENGFKEKGFSNLLVHDCEYMKVLNFNFEPGQELPVHNHDIEGELTICVLEGEGEFLGADGAVIPAKFGDVLISEIAEPHGFRATTRTRLLVHIAPPI